MTAALAANAGIPVGATWAERAARDEERANHPDCCGLCGGTGELAGPGRMCGDCGGTGLVKKETQAADSELIAFDRDSVREIDGAGRMHVELANICKACVSPYRGSEIPNWEKLSLDPDKVYQLLRDPEELEKGTPTANGIQILRKHIPVSADDHQPWDVIGAVGTNAKWRDPYIQNALTLWPTADIADVESGKKKQLSPGYSYTADMTPGTFKGAAFDGVMRNIKFNHLATVEDGRQGEDISIGDSAVELQWAAIERAVASMSA